LLLEEYERRAQKLGERSAEVRAPGVDADRSPEADRGACARLLYQDSSGGWWLLREQAAARVEVI